MLIDAEELRAVAVQLFCAAGVAPHVADVVAEYVTEADLCGYSTHGIGTIPSYLDDLAAGRIDGHAEPRVAGAGPGYMRVEGQNALGHFAMDWLVRRVTTRVDADPVCFAAMRDVGHIGRLGAYVEALAREGCLAVLTAGVALDPREAAVAPLGSATRLLGTNPLAIAAPTAGAPFVFDAATAAATEFGILEAARRGRPVPEGTLVDADGAETTNPEDLLEGGAILSAGHKGFGLSLGTCLLGALAGHLDPDAGRVGGIALLAIKVAGFLPADYPAGIGRFLSTVRNAAPLADARVRVPGDRARMERERQRADGVRISPETWDHLARCAARLGVALQSIPMDGREQPSINSPGRADPPDKN